MDLQSSNPSALRTGDMLWTLMGTGTLPTSLGGTQVSFGGVPAPLLFSSANQVNAIVPFAMTGRQTAELSIVHDGQNTPPVTVSIVEVQPGLFTMRGAGMGPAIILNQDGGLNSGSNPASKGSTVSIFATGAGQTNPPGVDGMFATNDSSAPLRRVEALIGGIGGEVLSARTARGLFAGVIRVDVRVPANVASSLETRIALAVGDVISPPATIAIR